MGPRIENSDDNNNNTYDIVGFTIPNLIMKKRDGIHLSRAEIEYFVDEVVRRNVQEMQLGAMLMAMYIRNLDHDETTSLTRAMTHSGDVLRWPNEWKGRIVDKHSTGGVGDKVSLILAPALAACGVKVPMVSGRGLGHTGGTLDKLEAIPGFSVSQSHDAMLNILGDVGCCIVGQTSNLVPADKIMYATRDVTSTTENIGLITSSIISKKAAESLDALVLDVKVGKGAFLKDEKDARELAKRMVEAGNGSGVNTIAMLTDMNTPLGNKIGNALEVEESIQCLHGEGPTDLTDLCIRLGGQLLRTVGLASDVREAEDMLKSTLYDGSAIAKFCAMAKAQGVAKDVANKMCEKGADAYSIMGKSKYVTELKCERTGVIQDIDAMKCAVVTGKLGAGRTKAGEAINFAVGLDMKVHIGSKVENGSTLIVVHHDEPCLPEEHISLLNEAIVIGNQPRTDGYSISRVLEVLT